MVVALITDAAAAGVALVIASKMVPTLAAPENLSIEQTPLQKKPVEDVALEKLKFAAVASTFLIFFGLQDWQGESLVVAANQWDGAATPEIFRISSAVVAPHERVAYITDEVSQRLVGAQARAIGDAPPAFDYRIARLHGMRLVHGQLQGVDIDRERQHLGDGDEGYSLFIALGSAMAFEQGDTRHRIERGGALLVSNARPVHSRFPNAKFALVQAPREMLGPLLANRSADTPPILASRSQVLLLRSYVTGTMRMLRDGNALPLAARHIAELMSGIFADAALSPAARQAARRAAMTDIMARRHSDPMLTMAKVAAEMGLSERAGYLAFAEGGPGFSDVLTGIRLDRARELLASSAIRVVDIAMGVGFSDLSHFNRRYRERFGVTPAATRPASDRHVRKWA